MKAEFRTIEERDNKQLATIIRAVFREFKIDKPGTVYTNPATDDLYSLFQKEGSTYLVAEVDGKLVGGCGIFPTEGLPAGCAELVKFYLSAEVRGQGLGLRLLQASLVLAKELGYQTLYLESFPGLAKAIAMYQKAGFQFIPQALGNSGHGACTVWMLLELG